MGALSASTSEAGSLQPQQSLQLLKAGFDITNQGTEMK